MKKLIAPIYIILFAFTGFATSAQAAVCDDLSESINRNLKAIAQINLNLIADLGRENSQMSQLMEQVQIGNEWQRVNISVQLMAQNKCPPLADATNYHKFSK
jgi:hypothetical protein